MIKLYFGKVFFQVTFWDPQNIRVDFCPKLETHYRPSMCYVLEKPRVQGVVKADFLKAVREAVAQRLIKAVKRLLYVVNKTNDCFKMHLTSVRLWASTFHY